jgi:hypothetical protein
MKILIVDRREIARLGFKKILAEVWTGAEVVRQLTSALP